MKDLKEYLDDLRSNIDIVNVISRYVKLKKRGRNYVGLCPFHDEKTPSFVVSPEKQIFHCFGCGASGDVVKFIMRIEDVDFKTAVRDLAKEAGIKPPRFSRVDSDNGSLKARLKEVMRIAAEFFKSQLNEKVFSYLVSRGVKKNSMEKFELGFAPENGSKFIEYAKTHGITDSELESSGLARKDQSGKLRSYFWNRVIIPIFDSHGDIVAFGGRIFGKGEPKYLNSPDTAIFTKGNLLYPINMAKSEIRKTHSALVVEGYFDALVLQQEGVHNAVSSMGTSFTESQAKLIKRFADTVYFLYDDDPAGAKGAERAIEVCSNVGVSVKVVVPFEGLDPDEIVLKYGNEKIREMINNARDPLEFIADVEIKINGDSPQGRARVIERLVETVSRISNKMEAYEYIKQIANKFGVDTAVLIDQYNVLVKNNYSKKKREELFVKNDKILAAEKLLTQAVIQKPDFLYFIENELNVEDFFDTEYLHIFLKAKNDIENGMQPDPKDWDDLSESELSIAAELALNDPDLVNELAIKQTIRNIKKDILLRSKAISLFKEFERTGDIEILKEYNKIQQKLKGRWAYFEETGKD